MVTSSTHAIALTGIQGHVIRIDAAITSGPAGLVATGLPDTAVRPTADRVRAAIINSGQAWPNGRITVSLSPDSLPKRGSGFDLGIAVAILAAAGTVRTAALAATAFIGELGLDGQLRPVPGILPVAAAAADAGFARVVTPPRNLPEAALVPGIQVVAPANLAALSGWLNRGTPADDAAVQAAGPGTGRPPVGVGRPPQAGPAGGPRRDLVDLAVPPAALAAAEICAAGGITCC